MEILDDYNRKRNELFNYFGYVENWKVIPIYDATSYYWKLDNDESSGNVLFAGNELDLINETGDHYENEIYTQRHLSKWVYRGEDYTMICVDTHTDGNKLLQIFKNSLER